MMKQSVISAITNRPFGSTLKLLIYFNPYAGFKSRSHVDNVMEFIEKTNLTS